MYEDGIQKLYEAGEISDFKGGLQTERVDDYVAEKLNTLISQVGQEISSALSVLNFSMKKATGEEEEFHAQRNQASQTINDTYNEAIRQVAEAHIKFYETMASKTAALKGTPDDPDKKKMTPQERRETREKAFTDLHKEIDKKILSEAKNKLGELKQKCGALPQEFFSALDGAISKLDDLSSKIPDRHQTIATLCVQYEDIRALYTSEHTIPKKDQIQELDGYVANRLTAISSQFGVAVTKALDDLKSEDPELKKQKNGIEKVIDDIYRGSEGALRHMVSTHVQSYERLKKVQQALESISQNEKEPADHSMKLLREGILKEMRKPLEEGKEMMRREEYIQKVRGDIVKSTKEKIDRDFVLPTLKNLRKHLTKQKEENSPALPEKFFEALDDVIFNLIKGVPKEIFAEEKTQRENAELIAAFNKWETSNQISSDRDNTEPVNAEPQQDSDKIKKQERRRFQVYQR